MSDIHYRGLGELYRGEQHLATVSYLVTDTPATRTGPGHAQGTLELIEGERDLRQFTDLLTLHLEDGQRLEVLLLTPIAGPGGRGRYRAQGAGPLRRD